MSVLRAGLIAAALTATSLGSAQTALADDGGRLPINPMQSVEKAKLSAFVHRPLFSPARSLPATPAALVYTPPPFVLPPPPPPNLQLVGVIEGMNTVAVVRRGAATTLLHTGEHIGQWAVTILPTGLRLTQGDRTVDYTLFNKGGGTSAPALGLGGPAAFVQPPRTPHPEM